MRFHALRCFTALASKYTGEKKKKDKKSIGFASCSGFAQKISRTAKRIDRFCFSAEEIANRILICSRSTQTPSVNALFLIKHSPADSAHTCLRNQFLSSIWSDKNSLLLLPITARSRVTIAEAFRAGESSAQRRIRPSTHHLG